MKNEELKLMYKELDYGLDLHNNMIEDLPNSIELLNQLTILHLYQNN